jgi:hypothetical protein
MRMHGQLGLKDRTGATQVSILSACLSTFLPGKAFRGVPL